MLTDHGSPIMASNNACSSQPELKSPVLGLQGAVGPCRCTLSLAGCNLSVRIGSFHLFAPPLPPRHLSGLYAHAHNGCRALPVNRRFGIVMLGRLILGIGVGWEGRGGERAQDLSTGHLKQSEPHHRRKIEQRSHRCR